MCIVKDVPPSNPTRNGSNMFNTNKYHTSPIQNGSTTFGVGLLLLSLFFYTHMTSSRSVYFFWWLFVVAAAAVVFLYTYDLFEVKQARINLTSPLPEAVGLFNFWAVLL